MFKTMMMSVVSIGTIGTSTQFLNLNMMAMTPEILEISAGAIGCEISSSGVKTLANQNFIYGVAVITKDGKRVGINF